MAKTRAATGAQSSLFPPEALRLALQYAERSLIEPDPEQPRDEPDAELCDSIARHGVLEPLLVRVHPTKRGRFMIVDGERRWKGSAGVQEKLPIIVRGDQEDEATRLVTQLVANTGRPLAPMEEARAFSRLVELTGQSVQDLAARCGRPRSTIGDRLALLELGPWQPLVEKGEIPVSHAIKVLVPVRGVPDDYHRQAIEAIRKDYRWTQRSKGGIGLEDFVRLVQAHYARFMYPLIKSTKSYGKNPEFDTKAHDKECACGTIAFDLDHGSKRKCCGNPDWWRPLDRKAKKAKPKKKSAGYGDPGAKRVAYVLPAGTATLELKGYSYDPPKGVAYLTARTGRWFTGGHGGGITYDPTDVQGAPERLVLLRSRDGDQVGTRDMAAVEAAKQRWQARWASREAALSAELRETLVNQAGKVTGLFVGDLLRLMLHRAHEDTEVAIMDAARIVGVALPKRLATCQWHEREKLLRQVVGTLSADDASWILTVLSSAHAAKVLLPTAQMDAELKREIQRIEKLPVPWAAGRRSSKAGGKGKKAKAAALGEDDDESAPVPCTKCGEADCDGECTDDLFPEGEDAEDEELAHA